MSKAGHPLPESREARRNEVPEDAERRKGEGEEGAKAVQATEPVEPDGTPYRAGDLGRGPPFNERDGAEGGIEDRKGADLEEELKDGQREHQDRGQRWIDDDGTPGSGGARERRQP